MLVPQHDNSYIALRRRRNTVVALVTEGFYREQRLPRNIHPQPLPQRRRVRTQTGMQDLNSPTANASDFSNECGRRMG